MTATHAVIDGCSRDDAHCDPAQTEQAESTPLKDQAIRGFSAVLRAVPIVVARAADGAVVAARSVNPLGSINTPKGARYE